MATKTRSACWKGKKKRPDLKGKKPRHVCKRCGMLGRKKKQLCKAKRYRVA